nr:reverse transcriptase domain-containing protein [Tanacetum cinerariifolium]
SITTWDDLVSKFINEFFPPSRTTNLRNEISNFQQKFDESFHEAWQKEKSPQDALTIIENKSKVRNSRSKPIASPVNTCDNHSSSELAELTHAVNQQTSAVTTAMTAMLKQFQSNPPPAQVKAVEEICVTCGGNFNQGNPGYRPQGVANQMCPPEKSHQDALTIIENKSKVRNSRNKPIASPVNTCDNHSSSELAKLTHAVNQQISAVTTAMTAMPKQFQSNPPPAQVKAVEEICVTCGGAHPYYQCLTASGNTFLDYRDNIQGYVSATTGNFNQGNPGYRPQGVANQMRPPGSGTLPGNTIANPKGELKAITTRSGLVTEGPTVPNPPKSVNPEENECVEETYTDPDHAEYNIKVPPPPSVQKPKPPIQRNFVLHTRDSLPPHIPYPSRMLKQKQQEKDDIQIQKFWNMFKKLHLNITFAEALILMPKYQKMLKALLSNKEKLQELANTPLNENCSAIILKKLPKKLGDPGKFLIPYGFSELKCKALADLGARASINLMPLSVWRKLGLPDLIPTRMTLELANRAICTPDEIARDVFAPVGKFTFPADFVVVDYESDPRVPLILGRPFLRTARALIDVHGEEMILRDGDESGNPTFLLHKEIASPEVIPEFHDLNGCTFLSEELPDIDCFNDIHPHFDDDPLSGSTTFSANSLLEEFADELALISYPPDYDDNRACDIEPDIKEIEFLLYQ